MIGGKWSSEWLSQNWFVPLAIVLAALAWVIGSQIAAMPDRRALAQFEAALTFDVVFTLPALYWLCYRHYKTRIALALRIVALQCLGIYWATWVIPEDARNILPYLEPVRMAGLVMLIAVELRLLFMVLRLVFRPSTDVDSLTQEGVPPLLAKLMLAEARFWRWLFTWWRR
ncbi:hypothetical protein [Blastomonas sp.]|uniref:hypothetical protein n=1 Tax=Blastomonas sp. TaxID=1909299 RepID=UPI003593EC25